MTFPPPNDDRPDPSEQPIRARVPEHVARGAFSTGVIVMTAQTEVILDFIQNLGRPHQIVARVVMPHSVLPQLVDALHRNMELYKNRWGELPHIPTLPPVQTTVAQHGNAAPAATPQLGQSSSIASGQFIPPTESGAQAGGGSGGNPNQPAAGPNQPQPTGNKPAGSGFQDMGTRRPSAQEIYDDLKIKDELLSGAYANAVMIGHGPHEFSFDFITNFFPNSAVSARVFLSSGQVPRFYDSLKGTWDQMRSRMQPPPEDFPGPTDVNG
jgi:Protein of unknown function (DUF3467)